MGGILSLNNSRKREGDAYEIQSGDKCKRQRVASNSLEDNTRLIPSLPDELSLQILARIPRICYLKIKAVSRCWKNAILSTELYSLRKELGTSEEWLYILTKVDEEKLIWHALDPLSRTWQRLPLMPMVAFDEESKKGLATTLRMWNVMGSSIRIADVIRGWLGRKDGLDRMAFCGCSVGSVDGYLYVLGGFSRTSALTSVWRYDPARNCWSEVSSMSIGRAYSKTGVLNNKLYVVGGVTRGRAGLVPLQSAEVYDPKMGLWTPLPSMPFSKAQVLPTAFLADLLKPIATGMTSYRGRLFVPQSLYCWPFFVDVGGEVYNPETDSWVEMPSGMGEGWPARQAGTKLSVTVEGELYSLDPSSSLDSAKIKVYDHQDDTWKVVAEEVPIRDLTDSESPYLLASLLSRLHVITKDANSNVVIMQADVQHNISPFPLSAASCSSLAGPSFAVSQSESSLWKVIATKDTGSAELVSCQNLDI